MNKIIDRNNKGQFVEGNKVGIGRPSRAIELDYLRSLSDTITVDDWRDICSKAVKDAKAGNAKAREWITRHVLGSNPTASLMDIAIRDAMNITSEMDVQAKVEYLSLGHHDRVMADLEVVDDVQRAQHITIDMNDMFDD